MAEYLCNGYECECGTRVMVCHNDRSKPMPDGKGYVGRQYRVPKMWGIALVNVERHNGTASRLD